MCSSGYHDDTASLRRTLISDGLLAGRAASTGAGHTRGPRWSNALNSIHRRSCLPGGATGVLLLHGFTGAPPEMRLIGDYLQLRGCTVLAPLLPGHGTTVSDMNRCRWQDWAAAAEAALVDLSARCGTVFVAGLSMGALLALYLAGNHPDLPGLVAYSPVLRTTNPLLSVTPFMKYLLPLVATPIGSDLVDPTASNRLWSYPKTPVVAAHELWRLMVVVRKRLPEVTVPLLIFYGSHDRTIHASSPRTLYHEVGSPDKELLVFEHSGHGITVDGEWEAVADRTYQFIRSHLPSPASAGAGAQAS